MSELSSIEAALRAVVPASSLAAAVVLDLVAWSGGTSTPPAPWLALAVAAFWSLDRPDLMPPLVLVAFGLAADLVAGTPPGLSSLVLVAVSLALASGGSEIRAQAAAVGWLAVALALLGGALLRHVVMSLWAGHLFPIGATALDAALTIAAFPLVAAALGALRPLLPRLSRVRA